MATAPERELVPELTPEEAEELFEDECRHYLGISGEEFLGRWDAGAYGDRDRIPGLMRVVMGLPMIGRWPGKPPP